jgi:hypothetical protein
LQHEDITGSHAGSVRQAGIIAFRPRFICTNALLKPTEPLVCLCSCCIRA